jgi:2-polyprenyl-6-hydroxyphenyl methylase/3-demethylubiquinone-9 3-methyltransferase
MIPFEQYNALFEKYGDSGEDYLRLCYPRYCTTKQLLLDRYGPDRQKRLLDIGAHFLHNATVYAMDGFAVTAAELSEIEAFSHPVVKGIAREFDIRLIEYGDLSNPVELHSLPENSFDCIMFLEILEHITFNPVTMWSALYRLLAPGGIIVVTTPNYFHCTGRVARDLVHVLRGKGSGISVKDIIEINTFGHHWREFSLSDIREYFRRLSPDFTVSRWNYFDYAFPRSGILHILQRFLQKIIPVWREALYIEITVPRKQNGIVAQPHW